MPLYGERTKRLKYLKGLNNFTMFSRENRLSKDKEVKEVFARGRAFFSPYFQGKYQKILDTRKFTVVVSTKVSKKAVDRNRIKRIMREQVRLHLRSFPEGNYVFSAKPKVMEIFDSGVAEEFKKFLKKANLII